MEASFSLFFMCLPRSSISICSVHHQQVIAYHVICHRLSNGNRYVHPCSTMRLRLLQGGWHLYGTDTNGSVTTRRPIWNRYIHGIDEGCKRWCILLGGIRPHAQYKADDGCGRNCCKPGRDVETTATVPRAYIQLLVIFVTQLAGCADDVFFVNLHIASVFV